MTDTVKKKRNNLKYKYKVVSVVRVLQRCGHETDYPLEISLETIRRLNETPCPECKDQF